MNLNRLKIGPRLALGFGALVALMLVIVAITCSRLEGLHESGRKLLALQHRAALTDDWRAEVALNASRAVAMVKSGGNKDVGDYFSPQISVSTERITSVLKELTALIDSEAGKAMLATIGQNRQIYVDARKDVLAKLAAGDNAGAQALLAAKMLPNSNTYVQSIEKLARTERGLLNEASEAMAADVRRAELLVLMLAGVAAVMAALGAWRITRSVTRPLRHSIAATETIAAGDLTQTIRAEGRDEMADMLRALGRMQGSLGGLVGQVRSSSDSIATASAEIATGNQDLSSRTEQTASNLQQAASSLEELTGTVGQTAEGARTANQLALSASEAARRGGVVVSEVVSTMEEINQRSQKIADIIGTIDGIAFQTNILALNAAVEAARAGEQGRGFAVVAGEVRSLAQRSAEAAREIKTLIVASVEKVEAGSRLVQQAGGVMGDIVGSVQRVSDVVGEISAATAEQTSGLRQVNNAVAELDQMTQRNAALVEESAAAAESMADQSRRLSGVVATFRVSGAIALPVSYAAPAPSPAAPAVSAVPSSRQLSQKLITKVRQVPPAMAAKAAAAKPAASPAKAVVKAAVKAAAKPAVRPAAPPRATAPVVKPAPVAPAPVVSKPAAVTANDDGDWETF